MEFCRCDECIARRTRFSGRFVDGNDYSKYPPLQQLIDLEEIEPNRRNKGIDYENMHRL